MKDMRCRSLPTWTVSALFLLVSLSFTAPLLGQTWVEIMVNGPWAIAPDTSAPVDHPRIILIAPVSKGHMLPVIFSGPEAENPPASAHQLKPKAYTMSIDKVIEQPNCASQPSDSQLYYPITLTPEQLKAALDGTAIDPSTNKPISRYTIALPKPCYVTSLNESRSKMGSSQITDTQGEARYATWTALHYQVSGTPSAKINGFRISFSSGAWYQYPALSIVIASPGMGNDNLCDHVSLTSADTTAKLLGLDQHLFAEFPIMLGSGKATYQTHEYNMDADQKCLLPLKPKLWKEVRAREVEMAKNPKNHGGMILTSAGSGDCHMTQTNINNAVQ
jgi:hypothetical protein